MNISRLARSAVEMKMIHERSLGRLLSLLSFFLAIHLGSTSTRPPDPADNPHNTTGLTSATTPASKPNWKGTTATAVIHRPNQSTSATTTTMSLDSEQNGVSHNHTQNETVSKWNATIATTGSTHISAGTTSSNSTEDTEVPVDSELSLGLTTSSPVTKATTATTPPVNAASSSVATVKATNPPPMTPTTQRARVPGMVSPRNNPVLASTPESTTLGEPFNLKHSKKTMTIIFSSLVGVAALVILLYTLDRCKQKKTQYLHRPLYNNSEETVERFVPADDTLVISGGLYDGPRVYNPTMTTANEDEDFHCDQPPFPSRSTQFQLKLLKEEGERPPSYEASTCQSSPRMDQDA
ncbi:A-agglutinin anchorage subunit-like [Anguilla anguilla]|uniref:A-agglutinin anchorage subunit-like n=1 Tax=Anguilla anguilla TaxID=7936 RepID=UPI0015AD670D|nr:A-agglutinin anchorage subunit-like [Anguilla anguilla]